MVERFYLLKTCIWKSFIDLDVDIRFSEKEVNLIQGIISSLLPIKLEVEKLPVITGKPVMPIKNYRKPVIQNLGNFGFPNYKVVLWNYWKDTS